MTSFVEVAFPLPLDTTFTYDLPEGVKGQVGQRVLAPFGKRALTGYVVALPKEAGEIKTKSIDSVLDDDTPLLTPALIKLARGMAQLYGASLGEAIQTIVPPGVTRQSRRKILPQPKEGEPQGPENETARKLLARIRKGRGLDAVTFSRRSPELAPVLKMLEQEGWIREERVMRGERAHDRIKKPTLHDQTFHHLPPAKLSLPQENAHAKIVAALDQKKAGTFLLHGITGSGKTEIYLRATEHTLSLGRTVLALVPEISLTPQFVGRFRSRFGERVALLHSARSESERLTEWNRIRRGEATVVIGARSAVFAPLEKIGLVVIDEEHDSSYKQEDGFPYSTKVLATMRAEADGATIVLGSATPSLETYEASTRQEITLLELPKRVTEHDLPEVELVDLRKDLSKFGEKGLFSVRLREATQAALERNEQVVLFLNRRGFAPIVLCPTCGESLKCPHCSVALTFHQRDRVHRCHYCDYLQPKEVPCPKCGQAKMIYLGIGTERVEQELWNYFPDARVARMDRDAVARKGQHEAVLRRLAKREIDILIGTQMVTKGMDFEHVSLVGVLLADQSLHFPDFRSAEQTFQLLTQVVGRAGRGKRRGQAIVQTFQPHHYAIQAAAAQDYKSFYKQEIEFRRQLRYPPFASMSLIELKGEEESDVRTAAMWLGQQARVHAKSQKGNIDILGPAPAPIRRIKTHYRYHLVIRSDRGSFSAVFSKWLVSQGRDSLGNRKVDLRLDIDPYRFL